MELNSSKAIEFNEFAELRCKENDSVTNDGFVTRLKCLPNGKFATRKWDDKTKCRERKVCTKSPPRPPTETGLARNYSRNVKEFGYATYHCINSHEVIIEYFLFLLYENDILGFAPNINRYFGLSEKFLVRSSCKLLL